jgi:hypothetical protein
VFGKIEADAASSCNSAGPEISSDYNKNSPPVSTVVVEPR